MQKLSAAYIEALETNQRIIPVAVVTWRAGTASPLILSGEPLPPDAYREIIWEGYDDFSAGTFAGTVLKQDEYGTYYITIDPDGFTAWVQHSAATQADWYYSPWLGTHADGTLFLLYFDAGTHLQYQTSKDGGTSWSVARDLTTEYHWTATSNLSPAVTIGTRTIVGNDMFVTDDNGTTWDEITPAEMWPSGVTCDFLWEGEDRLWGFDIATTQLRYSRDGIDWSDPIACTGLTAGGGGWTYLRPMAAAWTGERHLMFAVAYDTYPAPAAQELRIYEGISNDPSLWVLRQTFAVDPFVVAGVDTARMFVARDRSVFLAITGHDSTVGVPNFWRCQISWITEIDDQFPALAPMFTAPEYGRSPSFATSCKDQIIACAQYGANHAAPATTLWLTLPTYGTSGTWAGDEKDSGVSSPSWDRVAMAAVNYSGDTTTKAQFRTADTLAGVAAAAWNPVAAGWENGDSAASLDPYQFVQPCATLASTKDGVYPKLYTIGLQKFGGVGESGGVLETNYVSKWGTFGQTMGDEHVQQQFGTIEILRGVDIAAYWPWEGAHICIGLYPTNGTFDDVVWIASANVHQTSVQGDALTITLGEASE